MPTLHDFRADFSAGRTGKGLRIRQDTKAYRASVFDADNMMVEADNRLSRRWGTLRRASIPGAARLEHWVYSEADDESFVLVFSDQRLDIYDMTLTLRKTFTGQPWTETSMRFMTIASESNKLVLADATFKTQILSFDRIASDFSIEDFEFEISEDASRQYAPFYAFVPRDTRVYTTIYTSAGTSSGYGAYIQTASGFIDGADYDLSAGTGKLVVQRDVFTADYVGTRMRIAGGEVEITAVTNARQADIKVHRDIGVSLDVNPFFLRAKSKLCEVAAFDHGLNVGDSVIFAGLNEEAAEYVRHGLRFPEDGGNLPAAPVDGAAAYIVRRVVDKDHFEIQWAHNASEADTAVLGDSTTTLTDLETTALSTVTLASATTESALPTNDLLTGGSDVIMIPLNGLRGIKEPAFSDARGWPQACAIHETRLWLGGTVSLPDAVWGSRFFALRDFDPDQGDPDDAVTMYGIGDQAKVRHIVPGFDMVILTDSGEYYTPGSVDQAIVQSTARAIPATKEGAAYTTPFRFDGGLFFVDAEGQHIREMMISGDESEYTTNPATVVVPDWVNEPVDATKYRGGTYTVTPYIIFTNQADGSLLVMHSRRQDGAFGFMRWTLGNGNFVSVSGVRNRLFAAVERGGSHYLVEFDTSEDYITMDFGAELSADPATDTWTAAHLANTEIQMESDGKVYTPTTADGSGNFTTPEAVTTLRVGEAMPYLAELNPAIAASGQGPKVGKMQRLVDAEVSWDMTTTGTINDDSILDALDVPALSAPTPVDEWRRHIIGEWGREPRLRIEGSNPGKVALRGAVLNVYF
jgi:hypothetical protein